MKRIVLTGGGTAGHVTPNMALVPSLKEAGYDIQYIGSYNGIEKRLIEEMGIPYHGISSGKLRRYFDPKNFSDPFKVMKGYLEASHIIHKLKPDIVFSKGGFVSVPVLQQKDGMYLLLFTNLILLRDLPTRFVFLQQQRFAVTSLRH